MTQHIFRLPQEVNSNYSTEWIQRKGKSCMKGNYFWRQSIIGLRVVAVDSAAVIFPLEYFLFTLKNLMQPRLHLMALLASVDFKLRRETFQIIQYDLKGQRNSTTASITNNNNNEHRPSQPWARGTLCVWPFRRLVALQMNECICWNHWKEREDNRRLLISTFVTFQFFCQEDK